jgi:putative SOS response-associated peptidase YedK
VCNFTYTQGKWGLDEHKEAEWEDFRRVIEEYRAEVGTRKNQNPTDLIRVLRFREGKYHSNLLRFGLIPSWFDPARHRKTVNTQARSETIETLPSFRDAFATRRCIVVIDGFYEFPQRVKTSISRVDGQPLLIASIWERWESPEGEVVESVAMVTTEPTDWMRPYQDRQPLFLEPWEVPTWVEGTVAEARSLLRVSQVELKADPPAGETLF